MPDVLRRQSREAAPRARRRRLEHRRSHRRRQRRRVTASVAAVVAGTAVAVFDALRYDELVWDTVGFDRTRWLAGILALPVVGPLLYRWRARPKLEAAAMAVRLQGG